MCDFLMKLLWLRAFALTTFDPLSMRTSNFSPIFAKNEKLAYYCQHRRIQEGYYLIQETIDIGSYLLVVKGGVN